MYPDGLTRVLACAVEGELLTGGCKKKEALQEEGESPGPGLGGFASLVATTAGLRLAVAGGSHAGAPGSLPRPGRPRGLLKLAGTPPVTSLSEPAGALRNNA